MDEKNNEILEKYPKGSRESLIPMLQDIQEAYGYLSEQAVVEVGRYLDLPSGKIYGLATFYNQFRFKPLGQYHICFCHGTSCHVTGAEEVRKKLEKKLRISPGETTRDGKFSLELTACMGACHLSPVIRINGNYHTRVKPDEVGDIIDSCIEERED
ncbi:MAG: NADH-quinone oxidoreductase subunit NuoE [Marinilabiliales bacterium]|nr:MAG: NADH-quinone oxidoreductase subunit NuoE [Marinilabiliales bacterium]